MRGFRSFVHGLATAFELRGFLRSDPNDVAIDVQGDRESLD